MELIAILLLVPLISFSSGEPTPEVSKALDPRPVVAFAEGQWTITPPEDESLTMTVVETRPPARGPASAQSAGRRIDVIVTAP